MLVLSRKPGETIDITGPCKVRVIRIGPNSVRLGIEAEPDVSIMRSEVHPDPQVAAARRMGCISVKDIPPR